MDTTEPNWAELDPSEWPHTPPLSVYRELEKADPNLFWRLDSGTAESLLEQAIEIIDELTARVDGHERDNLRQIIREHDLAYDETTSPNQYRDALTDAIIAAGYRRPPRLEPVTEKATEVIAANQEVHDEVLDLYSQAPAEYIAQALADAGLLRPELDDAAVLRALNAKSRAEHEPTSIQYTSTSNLDDWSAESIARMRAVLEAALNQG